MSHSTQKRALRAAATAALGLALAGGAVESASAATIVTVDGSNRINVLDQTGMTNNIQVTGSGRVYTVRSLNGLGIVDSSIRCVQNTTTVVTCTNPVNIAGVYANLAAGNDILSASSLGVATIAVGGSGTDTITTGSGYDTVYGDAGNDTLTTNNGNDYVSAGLGNDRVTAGSGNDTIYGSDGADTLIGGLGSDSINAGEQIDTVYGDNVGDLLAGSNDSINVRDSSSDSTECSGGTGDVVYADPLLSLRDLYVGFGFTCESVLR